MQLKKKSISAVRKKNDEDILAAKKKAFMLTENLQMNTEKFDKLKSKDEMAATISNEKVISDTHVDTVDKFGEGGDNAHSDYKDLLIKHKDLQLKYDSLKIKFAEQRETLNSLQVVNLKLQQRFLEGKR